MGGRRGYGVESGFFRGDQPEWIVLTGLEQEGDKDQRYETQKDGSLLACGYAPTA